MAAFLPPLLPPLLLALPGRVSSSLDSRPAATLRARTTARAARADSSVPPGRSSSPGKAAANCVKGTHEAAKAAGQAGSNLPA